MRDELLVIMIVLQLAVLSLVAGYTINDSLRPTATEEAEVIPKLSPDTLVISLETDERVVKEYGSLPRACFYMTLGDDAYVARLAASGASGNEIRYELSKRIKIKGS